MVTVAASIDPRVGHHLLRIVAVHGDTDPADPYPGKQGRRVTLRPRLAAADIAARAALDGCPTTATTGVAPHIAVTTYPYGAQLVTVNGGGHT